MSFMHGPLGTTPSPLEVPCAYDAHYYYSLSSVKWG